MRVTSNKRDAFFIMTRDHFMHDCIMFSNMQRVACVASFFDMQIDELIDDCYNNEFDDFAFYSSNDFNDFIDHVYTHFIQ